MPKNTEGWRARRSPPSLHHLSLLFIYEVCAAVLLPATFVGLAAERLLFAVTEGFDTIAAHSCLNEGVLHRVRAIAAQSEVIFGRAALVAVPLNREADVGMLLQELRIALQRALVGRAY